jgi:hypothetical protein
MNAEITLRLPSQIHADGLVPFLSLLSTANSHASIHLDFENLRRVSPGGLVALVSNVTRWLNEDRSIKFLNLDQCPITGYLQRMNVLQACAADLPENFTRRDPKGRFVPLELIDHKVDELGYDLAKCLAPGGEDYDHPFASLYDLAWYVFTEIANNTRQHSHGLGFTSAQVLQSTGLVKMAIGDNGNGIRKSFTEAGLTWAEDLTDGQAIVQAMQPRISSKGSPTNEGVGLTLVTELAKESKGWLMVASGTDFVTIKEGGEPVIHPLPAGGRYQGTLVISAFRQSAIQDFAHLLDTAKKHAGLLPPDGRRGSFES